GRTYFLQVPEALLLVAVDGVHSASDFDRRRGAGLHAAHTDVNRHTRFLATTLLPETLWQIDFKAEMLCCVAHLPGVPYAAEGFQSVARSAERQPGSKGVEDGSAVRGERRSSAVLFALYLGADVLQNVDEHGFQVARRRALGRRRQPLAWPAHKHQKVV